MAFPGVELDSLRHKAEPSCLSLMAQVQLLHPSGFPQGCTAGLRTCPTLPLQCLWRQRLNAAWQLSNRFALFCGNKQISWRGFLGELGAAQGKSQGSRRGGQAERGLGWGEEDAVGSEALVEGDLSF